MNATLRSRQPVAIVCIALVLFAAFMPGVAIHLHIELVPFWLVVPSILLVVVRRTACRCDEQPSSLLTLVSPRAPPRISAFA